MLQDSITINFLRTSRINLSLSEHAHTCGQFDGNRVLLAALGCEFIVCGKLSARGILLVYGLETYHVELFLRNYITYESHMNEH